MDCIDVSGTVTEASGVGVIQRKVYPLLAQQVDLKEAPSLDRGGRLGAVAGLVLAMRPGRSAGGYFCVVSPIPLGVRGRLVTVVHDLRWTEQAGGAKQRYRSWDLSRAVRRSAVLLCVSEQTRTDLVARHPEAADKAQVVWLGPGILSDEDGWQDGRPGRLLLVGGAERKRNELTAEVLRHLPDGLVTAVVGVGVSPQCQASCEAVLGAGACTWLSRISDSELAEQYRHASYYAHFGLHEGFNLPFVEALRSGAVVVAIDQPLTREILADSAILLPDGTAEELAASWAAATVPEPDLRRRRGAIFSWQDFADAVVRGLGTA